MKGWTVQDTNSRGKRSFVVKKSNKFPGYMYDLSDLGKEGPCLGGLTTCYVKSKYRSRRYKVGDMKMNEKEFKAFIFQKQQFHLLLNPERKFKDQVKYIVCSGSNHQEEEIYQILNYTDIEKMKGLTNLDTLVMRHVFYEDERASNYFVKILKFLTKHSLQHFHIHQLQNSRHHVEISFKSVLLLNLKTIEIGQFKLSNFSCRLLRRATEASNVETLKLDYLQAPFTASFLADGYFGNIKRIILAPSGSVLSRALLGHLLLKSDKFNDTIVEKSYILPQAPPVGIHERYFRAARANTALSRLDLKVLIKANPQEIDPISKIMVSLSMECRV
jgi:hypothetical protein